MWRAVVEGRSVEEGAPCQSGAGARGQLQPWAMCCSQLQCDEGVPADSWVHSGLAPEDTKYLLFFATHTDKEKLITFNLDQPKEITTAYNN